MQIALAVNWEKEKEKTWSYTPYSLLTALQARTDIRMHDWDLRPSPIVHNFHRLVNIGFNRYNHRFTTGYRTSIRYKKCLQKKLHEYEARTPVDATIAIGDVGIPLRALQFIYTDCIAVEYKELLSNPFTQSMFQTLYSERELDAAIHWQQDILPYHAGVIFMSHSAASYSRHVAGLRTENIHVVPPASNMPRSSYEEVQPRPIDRPYMLFIGKEFHLKAGKQVVEAYSILKAANPDIDLVIIGPPDYERPEVLPHGVHWLGFIPREKLPAYFQHAEFLCVPSHVEAFGMVFAEALCFGIPVIARDCFAMPDIIKHTETGYLLPQQSISAEELAELMQRTLENSRMRERVRAEADGARAFYSWSRVADDFIRIITSTRERKN